MSLIQSHSEDILFLPQNLSENEKEMAFKQYEILIQSISNLNQTRENAGNLWASINGVIMTAITYLREAQTSIPILWALIVIGIILCLSWMSYLFTMKKEVEVRQEVLIELESYFPVALFKKINKMLGVPIGRSVLTSKQMIVPFLFFAGYVFFAVLLICFPMEIMNSDE